MLDPRLDAARDVEVSAGRCGGRRRARMTCLYWPFPGAHGRIRPGAGEREACQAGCVGLRPWRPLLVLGALLVLALADVLLRNVSAVPMPSFSATAQTAGQSDGYPGRTSATIRTAHSRNSGG